MIRRDHRAFFLWCACALVLMLPPWWIWGADLVAALLMPLVRLVFGLFSLPGLSKGDAGWVAATGLPLADGSGQLLWPINRDVLRRLLLGFPLFIAFMTAPPRPASPLRSWAIGLTTLALLFALSLTASVWGELVAVLNPERAAKDLATSVQVAAPPMGTAAVQAAVLGRYVSMSVLPLIAAILLWGVLNPRGRQALAPSFEQT